MAKKNGIDGAIAFLIYDFIQIMAIGDWDFVKNSQVLMVIWHILNALLCAYISWWILTERIEWKSTRKKKMAKNWIKKAIKKPGALRKEMGVKEGKDIPVKKLKKAAKKGDTKLAQRARLALTLKKMKKK